MGAIIMILCLRQLNAPGQILDLITITHQYNVARCRARRVKPLRNITSTWHLRSTIVATLRSLGQFISRVFKVGSNACSLRPNVWTGSAPRIRKCAVPRDVPAAVAAEQHVHSPCSVATPTLPQNVLFSQGNAASSPATSSSPPPA